MDAVTSYARAVVAGKWVVGRLVRLACERHLRDLDRAGFQYTFDVARAQRSIEFFPKFLRQYKGQFAGKRFELQPWQQFFHGSLFGWIRKGDGSRRFRKAYLRVARKNGKTSYAGGAGLMLLIEEPGSEVYSIATKKEQAKICFNDASQFVRHSSELKKLITVHRHNMHILLRGAKFEPMSRDSHRMDGLNPHGIIADEVHAYADRGLIEVMESGTGSRAQPLLLMVTTAGKYDRLSYCWEMECYSVNVLEGRYTDEASESLFPFIATMDDGDHWMDRSMWSKSNPNLGISVSMQNMEEEAQLAEAVPTRQNDFRTKRLNQWVEQDRRWMNMEKWDKLGLPIDEEVLRGRACFAGMDLGQVNDLSALALVFPPVADKEPWKAIMRFWCPSENIERRSRDHRVPYSHWRDAGKLAATPGETTDYGFIKKEILDLAKRYRIKELGYDRTFAQQIIGELEAEFPADTLVAIPQTTRHLSSACKELERMVIAGQLIHGNHPVLAWNMSNVTLINDAEGNIKPDKARSSEKIDGVSALVNAMARACLHHGGGTTQSVYEARGLITFG